MRLTPRATRRFLGRPPRGRPTLSDRPRKLFSGMTTDSSWIAALSLDELEAELARPASHLFAGTCRWLALVGELDGRGGWAEEGRGSCAEASGAAADP
jgi:hypothetical protein